MITVPTVNQLNMSLLRNLRRHKYESGLGRNEGETIVLCDAVVWDSEGRQPGGISRCQPKPVQIRRFQKEIWSMATPHYGYPGIFLFKLRPQVGQSMVISKVVYY